MLIYGVISSLNWPKSDIYLKPIMKNPIKKKLRKNMNFLSRNHGFSPFFVWTSMTYFGHSSKRSGDHKVINHLRIFREIDMTSWLKGVVYLAHQFCRVDNLANQFLQFTWKSKYFICLF